MSFLNWMPRSVTGLLLFFEFYPASATRRPTLFLLSSSAEYVLRTQPGSAMAHATLGEAWLLLGEPDQAERHLSEALRLDPTLDSARRELERARSVERRS